MLGDVFDAHEALDHYIIYLAPHQVDIDALLLEVLLHGAEAPFEAAVVLLGVGVLDVVLVLLVDRVVGEVRKDAAVIELARCGACWRRCWPILLGGEADEALPIDIDPQRIIARDDHVHAEVKLVPEEEQRVVDVAADHALLLPWERVQLIQNEDALAL